MKSKVSLLIFISSLSIFIVLSCTKEDYEPELNINFDKDTTKVMNYDKDSANLFYTLPCDKDSANFYYTIDYDKIYLEICTHRIVLKLTDNSSNQDLNNLSLKYNEIDSITWISLDEKSAYGYLPIGTECEVVKSLLIKLCSEDQILAVNHCYYLAETILSGWPIDDDYDLIGLTNEVVVKLKEGIPETKLDSLVALTDATLLERKKLYTLISTDKHSMFNSLELSKFLYETNLFEFSHPSIYMTPRYGI